MNNILRVSTLLLSLAASFSAHAHAMSSADKAAAIDVLAQRLDANYVFPETGRKFAAALKEHLKQGDYDKASTHEAFAELVSAHLREVQKDKHLNVRYVADGARPDAPPSKPFIPPPPEMLARMDNFGRYSNYQFIKVDRLPGNIAYIKLDGFAPADLPGAKAAAAAAMSLAANSDALIIDLRKNGGGSPHMVAHLASYLFDDKKILLSSIYDRPSNETTEFWTDPAVGKARPGTARPVYLLTSKDTFSAAEDFSYNLQAIKRVTVVGETTGGGAHPINGFRIDPYLVAIVPVARSINPVTGTNWEGVGVKPDIAISADKALAKANAIALRQLLPNLRFPQERKELEEELSRLEAAAR